MSCNFAILGAGLFPTQAYIPAISRLGRNAPVLKAVYSRSKHSAQALADAAATQLRLDHSPPVYHDADPSANLNALLARQDIHAVVIALPITVQPSVVLACLQAGKHVLSEKPVAPDVQQGLDLIRTYRSQYQPKGLVWRVAENFEAEPAYQAAAALIKQGRIGKVCFFKVSDVKYIDEDSQWYKTPWRTIPDYQGGFLLDGGVHTAAAVRTLLPPLTHLSAFASLNKDYLAPQDTIHVVAKADGSFHGLFDLTFASPTKTTPTADEIVVTGTDGWLAINRVGNAYRTTIKSMVKHEGKPFEEVAEIIDHDSIGVQAEFQSFFDRVAGVDDAEDIGDPGGALRDVAFIEAALKSNGVLLDLNDLVQV